MRSTGFFALILFLLPLAIPSEATAQRVKATLPLHQKHAQIAMKVAISPDSKLIAAMITGNSNTDERDAHLRLWDVKTNKEVARLRGKTVGYGLLFAFTPDGKYLVSSWWKKIHVWDVKTRKLALEISVKDISAEGAILTPDGKTIIAGREKLRLYDRKTGKVLGEIANTRFILRYAVSADSRWLAVSHKAGGVSVFDLKTRKNIHKAIPLGGMRVQNVAFSHDAKYVAADLHSGCVVFERESGRLEHTLTLRDFQKRAISSKAIAFTPDSKEVLLVGWGQYDGIVIWNPSTKSVRTDSNKQRECQHFSMALSKDGTLLVTGEDHQVRIWDVTPPKKK